MWRRRRSRRLHRRGARAKASFRRRRPPSARARASGSAKSWRGRTTEQAALAKARQELAAQEQVRSGEERNYARVQERLQPYKDSIETHEKNIEALKRELSNLYR